MTLRRDAAAPSAVGPWEFAAAAAGALVAAGAVVAGMALRAAWSAPPGREVEVSRVVDGDTFVATELGMVRVLGVDTPETAHPDLAVQPLGVEARDRARQLLFERTVRVQRDAADTDHYGRRLRHVWVGNELLAEVLLREGLGRGGLQPPHRLHARRLAAAEEQARGKRRGVWGHTVRLPVFEARDG